MKIKNLITIALAAIMSVSAMSIPTFAENNTTIDEQLFIDTAKDAIYDYIVERGEEYYTISDVSFNDGDIKYESDNKVSFETTATIRQKLKASDVEELPYIQGYLNAAGISSYADIQKSTDVSSVLNENATVLNAERVLKVISDRVDAVNEYIGEETEISMDFYVSINPQTAITKDNLEGDYDKVILAAGSTPAMPPITGIDTTVLASDYLTHQATVGKKVVVIGAGLAGTEAACDIAGKDGDVTLVEMCPDILFTANHCLNNDQHLRKMVKDRGVKVEANAKVTNITPTSVTFERDGQTMTLECDTVLNAVGFRPNNQLEELLDEKYDEVAVIGDAVAPRKILTAIHEGYHAIRVME